ncbi:hypothetical protein DOY81_001070 [Sarcophaga bullata]|nr:hypothetical protein DOY81_001070 [Sarcophaga bullata]
MLKNFTLLKKPTTQSLQNMVGPFMQGMLLLGIIYWYSKGLMNMINDYYRSEFNRKLKTEIQEQKLGDLKAPAYDLDDMDQLLNIEMNKEFAFMNYRQENIFDFKPPQLDLSTSSPMDKCYRLNSRKEFFNILFTIVHNYYRIHPINNEICVLSEYKNRRILKESQEADVDAWSDT